MHKKTVFIISAALLIAALSITYFSAAKIFYFQPTTTDENAYSFEAKLFLQGKFFTTPPPFKDLFFQGHLVSKDKWFSRYSPGHSFILLPGALFGFYNLMPIILSSLTILIIYFFLLKLTKSILFSALGAFITISSPFFIVMSGTYLSHTSCSFFVILYIFLFYISVENKLKNNALSFFMGFTWAFAFIIRQYTLLLLSAPFALYHIYLCIRHRCYRNIIYFSLGALPPLLFLFLYNYICTGNPLTQTYLYYDPSQKLGFGLKFDGKFNFTPQVALSVFKDNIALLNRRLFGLPFSLYLLLFSILPSKNNIWKLMFLTSVVLLIGGYYFFFYPGLGWVGPNYYYEAMPIMIILFFSSARDLFIRKKYILIALLIIVLPFYIFYYPELLKQTIKGVQKITRRLILYNDIIKENDIKNAVLLVSEDIPLNNSPALSDDILTVYDKGQENSLLALYYPDRRFYRFRFSGEKETSVISEIKYPKSFNQIFKFNDSFNNVTGRKIFAENSDKYIVYGKKGLDASGALVYGPYWRLPKGKYECTFFIRASNMAFEKPIAKIDICADSGTKILAERILKRSDFYNKKGYNKFLLKYSLEKTTQIETRVYFYSNSDVLVKQIEIKYER